MSSWMCILPVFSRELVLIFATFDSAAGWQLVHTVRHELYNGSRKEFLIKKRHDELFRSSQDDSLLFLNDRDAIQVSSSIYRPIITYGIKNDLLHVTSDLTKKETK